MTIYVNTQTNLLNTVFQTWSIAAVSSTSSAPPLHKRARREAPLPRHRAVMRRPCRLTPSVARLRYSEPRTVHELGTGICLPRPWPRTPHSARNELAVGRPSNCLGGPCVCRHGAAKAPRRCHGMQLAACHLACRPAPTVPRHVPWPESERGFCRSRLGWSGSSRSWTRQTYRTSEIWRRRSSPCIGSFKRNLVPTASVLLAPFKARSRRATLGLTRVTRACHSVCRISAGPPRTS